jgi:hypothetical protein
MLCKIITSKSTNGLVDQNEEGNTRILKGKKRKHFVVQTNF